MVCSPGNSLAIITKLVRKKPEISGLFFFLNNDLLRINLIHEIVSLLLSRIYKNCTNILLIEIEEIIT